MCVSVCIFICVCLVLSKTHIEQLFECFENVIWLKITIRTNKLEYLLYN